MPSDETIRLILDLGASGKNVQEVAAELDKLGDAAKRADAKIDAVSPAMEKVATSTDKAAKSTGDFNRTAIEGSRILQDFAQGGLGGIINNLEGFASSIGLSGGAAGAITALGVAALVAAPAIKALWKEIVDGSNEVPKSTDALARLSDELKTNKDRLKELADQGKLTNTELAEFNKLTEESTKLEAAANAEKERRNGLDALRKKEHAPDQNAGEIAQGAISEMGGPDVVAGVAQARIGQGSKELREAEAKVAAITDELNKQIAESPFGMEGPLRKEAAPKIDAAKKNVRDVRSGIANQAQDMTVAAGKGDAKAINDLAWLIPESSFQQATPEGMADGQAFVDKDQADAARIAKSNAKRKADEAMGDALTQQGGRFEADDAKARKEAAAKEGKDQGDAVDQMTEGWAREDDKAGRKADAEAAKAAAKADRDRDKASRDARPGAQLDRQQDQAFQSAAGVAIAENNGEFGPSQLESIAREAANNTQGLDGNSIRQAVYQAAAMTRMKMQADLDRQMSRMQSQSDSAFSY